MSKCKEMNERSNNIKLVTLMMLLGYNSWLVTILIFTCNFCMNKVHLM